VLVNQLPSVPFLFRNYKLKDAIYKGSNEYPIWVAMRATSAAPTYFEPYVDGDFIFCVCVFFSFVVGCCWLLLVLCGCWLLVCSCCCVVCSGSDLYP